MHFRHRQTDRQTATDIVAVSTSMLIAQAVFLLRADRHTWKLQFIYYVNSHGSKTAKITKNVILPTITSKMHGSHWLSQWLLTQGCSTAPPVMCSMELLLSWRWFQVNRRLKLTEIGATGP